MGRLSTATPLLQHRNDKPRLRFKNGRWLAFFLNAMMYDRPHQVGKGESPCTAYENLRAQVRGY